jgi:hypothetical protein
MQLGTLYKSWRCDSVSMSQYGITLTTSDELKTQQVRTGGYGKMGLAGIRSSDCYDDDDDDCYYSYGKVKSCGM